MSSPKVILSGVFLFLLVFLIVSVAVHNGDRGKQKSSLDLVKDSFEKERMFLAEERKKLEKDELEVDKIKLELELKKKEIEEERKKLENCLRSLEDNLAQYSVNIKNQEIEMIEKSKSSIESEMKLIEQEKDWIKAQKMEIEESKSWIETEKEKLKKEKEDLTIQQEQLLLKQNQLDNDQQQFQQEKLIFENQKQSQQQQEQQVEQEQQQQQLEQDQQQQQQQQDQQVEQQQQDQQQAEQQDQQGLTEEEQELKNLGYSEIDEEEEKQYNQENIQKNQNEEIPQEIKKEREYIERDENGNKKYFFGDDVIVYTTTFHLKHDYLKITKETWAKYIKHFVILSTEDDPSLPAIKMNKFRNLPDRDHRNPWIVHPSLRYLHDNYPNAKFYIKLDDDTILLLNVMRDILDDYYAKNNRYPYLSGSKMRLGGTQPKIANWEIDQPTMNLLTNNTFIYAPVGNYFGFSRELLEAVYPHLDEEKCPVYKGQDGSFGIILKCSNQPPTMDHWEKNLIRGVYKNPRDLGYTNQTSYEQWTEFHYYHHCKRGSDLQFVWNEYYIKFNIKP